MKISLLKRILLRDTAYLRDLLSCLKDERDAYYCEILEERLVEFVSRGFEWWMDMNNEIHRAATEKGDFASIDEWYSVLKPFLLVCEEVPMSSRILQGEFQVARAETRLRMVRVGIARAIETILIWESAP